MKIVLFYHSLSSDWNHGNAHFLRGIVKQLLRRGHDAKVYEPADGWSRMNLIADHGDEKAEEYKKYYPQLETNFYNQENPDYDRILNNVDLVVVHEWNPHHVVSDLGKLKKKYGYKLLFHDTHHRAVSESASMSAYDLSQYDGALVFGEVIKRIYEKEKWIDKAWTWHEAADVDLFRPISAKKTSDLVWIGNWGDDERTEELMEFLIQPVKQLGLKAKVFGVRYPAEALRALKNAGIEYGGWLPNYKVPEVFAQYKVTVHVPRGPYVKWLKGIPTIRPFEALACGIPLISSPWEDAESLFSAGEDYLVAKNGEEMKSMLWQVLSDASLSQTLSESGRRKITNRHTCSHRVNQLEKIWEEIGFSNNKIYPEDAKILNQLNPEQ